MNYLLIFALVLLLGAWINLHAKRTKGKKRFQEETQEILLDRFKGNVVPVRRDGKRAGVMEKTDDFPPETNRSRMNVYSLHRKNTRSGKERRNSRVPVGITFEVIDRRQTDGAQQTGPERRSGVDRRGKYWDRRKPVAFQYS
jgi:hypothetical protein